MSWLFQLSLISHSVNLCNLIINTTLYSAITVQHTMSCISSNHSIFISMLEMWVLFMLSMHFRVELEEDHPLEIALDASCSHRNSKLVLRDNTYSTIQWDALIHTARAHQLHTDTAERRGDLCWQGMLEVGWSIIHKTSFTSTSVCTLYSWKISPRENFRLFCPGQNVYSMNVIEYTGVWQPLSHVAGAKILSSNGSTL